MDSTTILAIAISVLSAVLIAVGIYAIVILREVHRTTRRIRNIVDRVDSVTEAIDSHLIKPGGNIVGVLSLLKEGAGILAELRQTSSELATNSRVVGEEVKKAGKAVKEAAPIVAHHAKDVIDEATLQQADVIHQATTSADATVSDAGHEAAKATHHAADHAHQVIKEATNAAKDVVDTAAINAEEVISTAKQPEPMKAQSLASRRRFFTRR